MIPHDPEERRALIGEYQLGLLDEHEAAEVRQLLEDDENAARMALGWERHFLELSDRVPAQPPSPALWARIRQSLGLHDEPHSSPLANWWNSLLTWRLTTAALAMALLVADAGTAAGLEVLKPVALGATADADDFEAAITP